MPRNTLSIGGSDIAWDFIIQVIAHLFSDLAFKCRVKRWIDSFLLLKSNSFLSANIKRRLLKLFLIISHYQGKFILILFCLFPWIRTKIIWILLMFIQCLIYVIFAWSFYDLIIMAPLFSLIESLRMRTYACIKAMRCSILKWLRSFSVIKWRFFKLMRSRPIIKTITHLWPVISSKRIIKRFLKEIVFRCNWRNGIRCQSNHYFLSCRSKIVFRVLKRVSNLLILIIIKVGFVKIFRCLNFSQIWRS